jgi:protein required for attachment to host cells
MANTWVLVAHDAGARVFENRGRGKGLQLIYELDHPAGRMRDRDFDSDRAGRSFRRDAGDTRRAAMGRSEGPHEHAVADFARQLAGKLQQGRTENAYGQLVLAAPPKFLGQLRSSLDAPTAKLLIGSIDKDLASSDEAEIIEQIGEVVLI